MIGFAFAALMRSPLQKQKGRVQLSAVVPFMSMGFLIGWRMEKLAQRVKGTLAFTLRSLRENDLS
jgi:hypothetical protein